MQGVQVAHDEATDAKKQKQFTLEENTKLEMQLQQMREEVAASTANIEAHGVDNQIANLMTQLQVIHTKSKSRVSFVQME